MAKDNKRLIETFENRLKETKKKRDEGKKSTEGEASFAQQIKGLNKEIKELKAENKKEGIGAQIARKLGDQRSEEEMIKTREMNEEDEKEMGMNKGGMAGKKVYGMREGGFTKRGGMYKKGY